MTPAGHPMETRVMQPSVKSQADRSVHQRYRRLLRAGFTAQESAALIAVADGIAHHAEGEAPATTPWHWQEITQIQFLAYLAQSGRMGGIDDGRPMPR